VHGVLYVEDLVDEFWFGLAEIPEIPRLAGQAFNAHERNPETLVDGVSQAAVLIERGASIRPCCTRISSPSTRSPEVSDSWKGVPRVS
jgi:hypothetical protein